MVEKCFGLWWIVVWRHAAASVARYCAIRRAKKKQSQFKLSLARDRYCIRCCALETAFRACICIDRIILFVVHSAVVFALWHTIDNTQQNRNNLTITFEIVLVVFLFLDFNRACVRRHHHCCCCCYYYWYGLLLCRYTFMWSVLFMLEKRLSLFWC